MKNKILTVTLLLLFSNLVLARNDSGGMLTDESHDDLLAKEGWGKSALFLDLSRNHGIEKIYTIEGEKIMVPTNNEKFNVDQVEAVYLKSGEFLSQEDLKDIFFLKPSTLKKIKIIAANKEDFNQG